MKTSGGDRVGTALKAVLPILPCSDLIIRDGHAYILSHIGKSPDQKLKNICAMLFCHV